MKKFFEKHDLVKLSGLFMIMTALFTWLVSNNSFSNGELVTDQMLRVGLFDITTYGLLGMYYFTATFLFVFFVAGFYKFLGSTEAYNRLTDKFAGVFEGKEKVFVAISILVYACLAGISTDHLVLLAFIPFTISILAKLKVDKVSGLLSTFGGVLIGVLGSTYSSKVVGQMVTSSTVSGLVSAYNYEMMGIGVIFVLAYILLLYFVFARLNKTVKENELLEDPFITVIPEAKVVKKGKKVVAPKKVKVLPLAISMIVIFVIIAMAYVNWEKGFGITLFKDVHTWIKTATLFDQPIYYYLLGNMFLPFGEWDLFGACAMLFVATLIIKVLYRIPLDNILTEYGEGFKKMGKTIVVLLIVYNTLVLSFVFPTVSYFINQVVGMGENIFTLFIGGGIASIFAIDFQFVFGLVGNLFATFQNTELAAFILQVAYGFVGFIAPTSAILMLGLSMLDIKFKDYFKGIWKFLLALLIVIFVVIAILMYV